MEPGPNGNRRPAMHRRLALLLLALLLAFGTVACAGFPFGGGGGIAISPPDPGTGQGGTGGGSGAGGSGGSGGGVTGPGDPAGPGGVDPITGMKPSLETPVPGQFQPRAVNVWAMTPTIDGHHVTVLVEWWSGPPPCSVLDSVVVTRDGSAFRIVPMEGSDPASHGQVACPAIAMLHGTIVDLGDLAAGTYSLSAPGDLAPVEVTVR